MGAVVEDIIKRSEFAVDKALWVMMKRGGKKVICQGSTRRSLASRTTANRGDIMTVTDAILSGMLTISSMQSLSTRRGKSLGSPTHDSVSYKWLKRRERARKPQMIG